MKRRKLLTAFGAGALVAPLSSLAQQPPKVWRIGYLSPHSRLYPPYARALLEGMGERGYVEGKNLVIEWRFADGEYGRLPALAAELVRRCKVAALGTLHHGAPSVSMVPYAIIEDPFAFVVLVSALSAHTKEMLGDPNVALMIMEPESDTKPPHTLARVSMQGRAEPISQDDPRFGAARAAYTARFPDMVGLFELGDVTLFAIAPAAVRIIAGFAQAASITPASMARSVRHTGQ